MKKKFAALLLPVMACAQMGITTHERVAAEAFPDVLRGDFGFEEQNKNPDAIKEHFNAIVAAIKRADPDGRYCRGGGYRLFPRYSYKNQKQEFLGYGGSLLFVCEVPQIDHYTALNVEVEKVLAPEVRKTQGALSWEVSASKSEAVRRELRQELIRKALREAEMFSAQTALSCVPAKIHFSPMREFQPMMVRAMESSIPVESPIRADAEVAVEASVDYSCVNRVP